MRQINSRPAECTMPNYNFSDVISSKSVIFPPPPRAKGGWANGGGGDFSFSHNKSANKKSASENAREA